MSLENRYIYVRSLFESELIQILLFEAGASWVNSGQNTVAVFDTCIAIDRNLKMFVRETKPLHSFYKELSILELVTISTGETFMETETLHVCEVSDNHISFEDSEVAMTTDELAELLPIIQAISHRDFEITTSDGDDLENGGRFSLTSLTINFK